MAFCPDNEVDARLAALDSSSEDDELNDNPLDNISISKSTKSSKSATQFGGNGGEHARARPNRHRKRKMASLASSNTSSCSDNFDDWCTRWKIPTSVIQLCNNLGASVPSDLVELDAQRIEKFIQENQLLEIDAIRFRKGYQAVVQAMSGVS